MIGRIALFVLSISTGGLVGIAIYGEVGLLASLVVAGWFILITVTVNAIEAKSEGGTW